MATDRGCTEAKASKKEEHSSWKDDSRHKEQKEKWVATGPAAGGPDRREKSQELHQANSGKGVEVHEFGAEWKGDWCPINKQKRHH